jgi:hypothetical protein
MKAPGAPMERLRIILVEADPADVERIGARAVARELAERVEDALPALPVVFVFG